MSTENNTEEPKKKTIEEMILSKQITQEIYNNAIIKFEGFCA